MRNYYFLAFAALDPRRRVCVCVCVCAADYHTDGHHISHLSTEPCIHYDITRVSQATNPCKEIWVRHYEKSAKRRIVLVFLLFVVYVQEVLALLCPNPPLAGQKAGQLNIMQRITTTSHITHARCSHALPTSA